MAKVLKWKTNSWEKTTWRCRIFGHYWESGWWGDAPYLKSSSIGKDGIGRSHNILYCECSRCGNKSAVAYIHGEIK